MVNYLKNVYLLDGKMVKLKELNFLECRYSFTRVMPFDFKCYDKDTFYSFDGEEFFKDNIKYWIL